MSTMTLRLTFLLVALVVGCHGDEEEGLGVKVSIKDGEVDISLQGLPDPCTSHVCSEGEECVTVYHPELLDVPTAHCVTMETEGTKQNAADDQNNRCIQFSVGTNIVSCKSQDQWKAVGHNQCTLRGGNDMPLLIKTNVQTACHSFGGSFQPVFLKATFTCCADDYNRDLVTAPPSHNPPPPQPLPSQPPPSRHHGQYRPAPVDHDRSTTESSTDAYYDDEQYTFLFAVVGGVVITLAVVAVTLAFCQRRRRVIRVRKGLKTPRVILATSFINPNVDEPPSYDDEWIDHHHDNDKSLLIFNESTTSSGNK